jgi:RNA polymerase sigma factor for flagellar operon FliA
VTAARALVEQHLGLAQRIARGRVARMPASVELDDVLGHAVLGLCDAAARFSPAKGVPFAGYAARRIDGAITDMARGSDHLSRRERRQVREGVAVAQRSAPEFFVDGGETLVADGEQVAVGEMHDRDALAAAVRGAVAKLPERLRLVVSLYCEREMTYREIGAVLEVSEARICQLMRDAHRQLRESLAAWA